MFLDELNFAINKDIIFISRVLNFIKIKSILINTDQTIFAYIFIHTAKINNIKTAVLAHGNFSSPFAVGVLPLFADRLFVWSEKVKNDLNKLSNKNIEYLEGINKYIILPKELNNFFNSFCCLSNSNV